MIYYLIDCLKQGVYNGDIHDCTISMRQLHNEGIVYICVEQIVL